ncbi:uncharacterized protein LOC106158340 [Lingula anatina]|uniref:Uncharacterized protein LOC106158340 n=1 Tax=Lingula anatina TaxID=7574 RepID=A0A1S3HUK5_LINAN|nr:uncharacterized protein LOC106158340 [Lingula anatina]|eukprot:XP_013389725.1 uncharacterized protein LOC106158340 [Lingula anatina]
MLKISSFIILIVLLVTDIACKEKREIAPLGECRRSNYIRICDRCTCGYPTLNSILKLLPGFLVSPKSLDSKSTGIPISAVPPSEYAESLEAARTRKKRQAQTDNNRCCEGYSYYYCPMITVTIDGQQWESVQDGDCTNPTPQGLFQFIPVKVCVISGSDCNQLQGKCWEEYRNFPVLVERVDCPGEFRFHQLSMPVACLCLNV